MNMLLAFSFDSMRGFDCSYLWFDCHSVYYTVGSCPWCCHVLSGINEYMPHTSTVYLALPLINPVVKTGKSNSFTPIPFRHSHTLEQGTAFTLPQGACPLIRNTPYVPHDEPPSSVCCLHVAAWFTGRQQHVIAALQAF